MTAAEIRNWLVSHIGATVGMDPEEIDVRAPFDSFGLSSRDAVVLSGALEALLERDLSATLVYEYPTITALAEYLGGGSDPGAARDAASGSPPSMDTHEPIAIVGIACRFPGASDPPAYWNVLRDGRDLIREVPSERWDARAFYHPDAAVPGKAVSRWGGFLEQVDRFDPFFFGISPGEAERMDPQQRLLLELAYESMEDAGYSMARLMGSRTGVFVGVSINEYALVQYGRHELINGHSGAGNALSIAANRISYFFDLHGPSLAVDTACSSSLMAIHLACRSLRSGECALALAGGVNIVLSPAHSIAFTKAGVLAPDGRCKVFDARADGYVRGEGGGLVVLKPLGRALADDDVIYAVIRGSAVQQDGRTNGLMAPSREAQEAVLRAAYRDAGVSPGHVQYVEAHGTGTLLGDSIEAQALGAVVGADRSNGACALGSVKSNLGHLEAAAGIAGLVKVALSLRHRVLPPSLHFETPNPHIPFEELGLRVQRALTPWPDHTGPALAGVSSFGFGGTNVHVVLEEAPHHRTDGLHGDVARDPAMAQVLPLSAHTPSALRALAGAYADLLTTISNAPGSLADLCASASTRRNHLDHRVALVAHSLPQLAAALEGFVSGASQDNVVLGRRTDAAPAKLVFVFSGQGSQWHGMGRELLRHERVFRDSLEECEQLLRRQVNWSLFDELAADERRSRLGEIDVLQPTLFALQVALANLWRSWGIEPDAVVGHSMGEAAAAFVAGALTLEDAASVICARSRLLRRLSGRGGMAVVGLPVDETARYLSGRDGRLSIAASNSPSATVVSGETAALMDLTATLQSSGVYCSLIKVDVASHSPQTAPLADELQRCLADLQPRPASPPFVSTVTGAVYEGNVDGAYWARNLTELVQFAAAIQNLVHTGHRAFVEISPHPVLQSSVQQCVMRLSAGKQSTVLPSTRRDEPERGALLQSLGALYAAGRDIDWGRLYPSPTRPVSLPTYPWQRERFWLDGGPARPRWSGRGPDRSGQGAHPLLGDRVALAHAPASSVWQTDLDPGSALFLRDHRVNGAIVFPASAFIELALAVAARAGVAGTHSLSDLDLRARLVLTEGAPRVVQVALIPEPDGVHAFRVFSQPRDAPGEEWTLHATASFVPDGPEDASPHADPAVVPTRAPEGFAEVSPDELYGALGARGLEYGPALRGIDTVWRRDGEALGHVSLPQVVRHEADAYRIHPALLDAALQVLAATLNGSVEEGADDRTYVPVGCQRVKLHDRPVTALWSHVVLRAATPGMDTVEADVHLSDDSGRRIGVIAGLRLARISIERGPAAADRHTWTYGVRWRPVPWAYSELPLSEDHATRWLILADRHGLAEALQQQLQARGQRCQLLAYDNAIAAPPEDGPDAWQPRDDTIRHAIGRSLDAEPSPMRGVIHLWSAGVGDPPAGSPTGLRTAQLLGCNAVVSLVQGLVGRASLGTPRLWLVTRGTQPALSGELVSVAQAPLWGLGRTIGFELPALKCTLVDVDPALDAPAAARLLLRQLSIDDAEDQVALRGEHRFVPRLSPLEESLAAPSCAPGAPPPFRPDGTYLITGGLGGLGLAVARWMIEQGARHLALLGRRAPSPGADAAVRDLRRVGGGGTEVAVFAGDVAVERQLATVLEGIRETMPPLRGIVHAAGVLDNAPIVSLDAGRMARVLAPKVDGAWNLHLATAHLPLDFFVLFSSAVSVLGSPGQGNYAAANAFLDALAHRRRRAGLPAVSINWGPWADVGLVASAEVLQGPARSDSHGVKSITPRHGLEALGRALRGDRPQVTVLPFDMRSLLDLYPAAAGIPFFSDVGGRDSHVSRLYTRPDLAQEYIAPRTEIERKLVELWRQTLRIDRVGIRDSFFELGGDSVLAAQIVTSAHRVFGVGIDLREAFQAFTIEHLAQRVEDALVARVAALSESEAQRLLDQ